MANSLHFTVDYCPNYIYTIYTTIDILFTGKYSIEKHLHLLPIIGEWICISSLQAYSLCLGSFGH